MGLRFKDLPTIGEGRMAANERTRPRIAPNIFSVLARAAVRHRLAVILTICAFALVSAGIGVSRFDLNPAQPPQLELDPAYAKARSDLDRAFPDRASEIVLTLTAEEAGIARSAAVALVRELRGRSELFSGIVAPGLGKAHEENAILYASQGEARRIADGLERRAPLFRALASYPNLAGLAALAQQVEASISAGTSPEGLEGLFAAAAKTAAGEAADKPQPLDWTVLVELVPRPEQEQWNVHAYALGPTALEAARDIAGTVAATGNGVSIKLDGPALERRNLEQKSVYSVRLAAILGLVLATITLLAILGGPRNGLAVAASLMALAGLALALPILDGRGSDIVSMFYLPLVLLLGAELFSAHALRAWELEESGYGRRSAVVLAVHRCGLSSVLLAAGALAGLAWLGSGYQSMRDLGLRLAIGALAAAGLALSLVPALLSFGKGHAEAGDDSKNWLDQLLDASSRALWRNLRAGFSAAAIIIAIAGVLLAPTLRLAPDRIENAAAELVVPPVAAQTLTETLRASRDIGRIRTIADFLPLAQPANIAAMAKLRGAYPPRAADLIARAPQELRGDFDRLQASLRTIGAATTVAPALGEAANELRRALDVLDSPLPAGEDQLRRLEVGLFGGLDALLTRIARLSSLEPLGIEALDDQLKQRFLAKDGRWRVEIHGADGVAAGRFAAFVHAQAPLAVGPAIDYVAARSSWPHVLGWVAGLALLLGFLLAFRRGANALAGLASFAATIFLLIGLLAIGGTAMTVASAPVLLLFACLAAAIACRPTLRSETSRFGGGTARRGALLGGATMLMAGLPLLLTPMPLLADVGRVAVWAAGALIVEAIMLQPQIAYWFGLETWRFRNPG